MRVQRSIEIAAAPDKIWPFMVEPEKILKWCITFKKFEYTSEKRSSVGTTFYLEEKAGPMPLMKLNFKVTEWVENERLAFRMTSGNTVKSYEQGWTVKATPNGSRFTFIEDVELPLGIIGKLIGLVGKRSSDATVKEMLAKLKSLAKA
ncbi:SRPBCC family protein [Chloroflexota bacterium]